MKKLTPLNNTTLRLTVEVHFCSLVLGDVTAGRQVCEGQRTEKNRGSYGERRGNVTARPSFVRGGFALPGREMTSLFKLFVSVQGPNARFRRRTFYEQNLI